MAAALASLEIVALRRLDRTQTRTAALAVDDQAGEFGAGQVAQPLGHQADAPGSTTKSRFASVEAAAVDHVGIEEISDSACNTTIPVVSRLELHQGLHHLRSG